jgi:anti-anti-sigma factor
MLKIVTRYSRVPVVYVTGQVVDDDAANLKTTLLDLADKGYEAVALEASGIQGIDSAGIGALLAARGRLGYVGGALSLVGASEKFLDDLRDTGLMDLFVCFDRLEDVPAAP